MIDTIIEVVALGVACGMISLTVTRGDIFKKIREFFFFRTQRRRTGRIYNFFSELLSCPYCFSHWVAFFMAGFWQPKLTNCGVLIADLAVTSFVIVGISSITWAAYQRLL